MFFLFFTHSVLEGLRDGGTIDRAFAQDDQLTFKELTASLALAKLLWRNDRYDFGVMFWRYR